MSELHFDKLAIKVWDGANKHSFIFDGELSVRARKSFPLKMGGSIDIEMVHDELREQIWHMIYGPVMQDLCEIGNSLVFLRSSYHDFYSNERLSDISEKIDAMLKKYQGF